MSLFLHSLKPTPGSRRGKKRLGRGNASGHGTTATRGTKGQRARQGGRKGLVQFGVKHFVTRLPKVRGFESLNDKVQAVTLASLARVSDGATITPQYLKQLGLIVSIDKPVKLIGQSNRLPKKLTVKVQALSAGARAALEKAGAQIELQPLSASSQKK